MVQAKMNLHLNLPIYSPICMSTIKDENIINSDDHAPHTQISTRKWRPTTFQLAVALREYFQSLFYRRFCHCWKFLRTISSPSGHISSARLVATGSEVIHRISSKETQQTFVLVKTYWRRLQDVFSVTFFLSSKTSWRHNCKTSCKHVLKTF